MAESDALIQDARFIAEAAALEAIAAAARTTECNFQQERECGWAGTIYVHHKTNCPRGRLTEALRHLDALRESRGASPP